MCFATRLNRGAVATPAPDTPSTTPWALPRASAGALTGAAAWSLVLIGAGCATGVLLVTVGLGCLGGTALVGTVLVTGRSRRAAQTAVALSIAACVLVLLGALTIGLWVAPTAVALVVASVVALEGRPTSRSRRGDD